MGKYLNRFKRGANKSVEFAEKKMHIPKEEKFGMDNDFKEDLGEEFGKGNGIDNDFKDNPNFDYDPYNDVGIQPAQKPESFHHFILENQYKDLERSIRGYKDIYEKENQQWKTVRKQDHCFTDEEAEEILRTAQSHLATDIKLGYVQKDSFPLLMDAIYQEIEFLFTSIAEYRYGRYGSYENQYKMKLQNHKIFLELYTRIQANYSRSIQGQENRYTHDSVKGQESLNQSERDFSRRGYS